METKASLLILLLAPSLMVPKSSAQSCGEASEAAVFAADSQLRMAIDIADELRATCPELRVNVLPRDEHPPVDGGTHITLQNGEYRTCVAGQCFSDPLEPTTTLPIRAVEALRSLARGATPVHLVRVDSVPLVENPPTPQQSAPLPPIREVATDTVPVARAEPSGHVEAALSSGIGLWVANGAAPAAATLHVTLDMRWLHDQHLGAFLRGRFVSPWFEALQSQALGYLVRINAWSIGGELGAIWRPIDWLGLAGGLALDATTLTADSVGLPTATTATAGLHGVVSLALRPIPWIEVRVDARSGGYLSQPRIGNDTAAITFGKFRFDMVFLVGVQLE